MADRYLRANGNWNGSVWASTSGGTAGTAATPTSSDNVYIESNFTVTLTANAQCQTLRHTNGTLRLSSYTLELTNDLEFQYFSTGFVSTGTTARTIELQFGILIINSPGDNRAMSLEGSNLSFLPGRSQVIFNVTRLGAGGADPSLYANGHNFNDVIIRIGEGEPSGDPNSFGIVDPGTFNLLYIKSENDQSHTVYIDRSTEDFTYLSLNKLILIGGSTSNKMELTSGFAAYISPASPGASCYGENINIERVNATDWVEDQDGPTYLGSTSTIGFGADGWVLADPPKINTVHDDLSVSPASNENFTYSGNVTAIGGGGYRMEDSTTISSKDTFDLTNSDYIVQLGGVNYTGPMQSNFYLDMSEYLGVSMYYNSSTGNGAIIYRNNTDFLFPTDLESAGYVRVALSGTTLKIQYSSDGVSWVDDEQFGAVTVDPMMFKSVRLFFQNDVGGAAIGSTTDIIAINTTQVPIPSNTGAFFPFF